MSVVRNFLTKIVADTTLYQLFLYLVLLIVPMFRIYYTFRHRVMIMWESLVCNLNLMEIIWDQKCCQSLFYDLGFCTGH